MMMFAAGFLTAVALWVAFEFGLDYFERRV